MEHTYSQFDTDLHALRSAITTMAALVDRQVLRAVDAIRLDDLAMTTQVLADEAAVNRMHLQIDLRCNTLIAKRQPMAVDLREVVAVLHMNNDLERVGDEAKKIAYKARDLHAHTRLISMDRLHLMVMKATSMLRDAVQAFTALDRALAAKIANDDLEVDRLRDELINALVEKMEQDASSASSGLAMIFAIQSIERIGDHAKNVGEYVINIIDGVDSRHARKPQGQG